MTVKISLELETEFRKVVFKKKGMRRGNIKEAVEEALHLWIKANK